MRTDRTNKNIFFERFKADPFTQLIAILSLITGVLFIFLQGSKLLPSDADNAGISSLPIGRFDLGFALADTLIPGPILIAGALCLLFGRYRPGHLFVFSGWAINLYGIIVFFAGYAALGKPLSGQGLVEAVVTVILSLFCLIWSAISTLKEQ